MKYYIPLTRKEEQHIWNKQKLRLKSARSVELEVPDDERVEDAGLEEAA